ncbi:MAG: copper-translocating P-type ATPase [Bryobacterales bacterium]|nr:copper-translocating P-type ATPase [Bryobacterales bacterium]
MSDEPNPELIDMRRRFWISLTLTVPLLVLMFVRVGGAVRSWVELALATPVVLWRSWPFFERGWASVVSRNFNMFTLIALGTGVAFVFSMAATLFPGAIPPSFQGPDGEPPIYFEPAAGTGGAFWPATVRCSRTPASP